MFKGPLLALAFALCLVFVLASPGARAASLCAEQAATNAPLPLPLAYVGRVKQAFGLHAISPTEVQKLTVARCMGGHLYACFVGANLPCGPANTSAHLPAATSWCQENPNTDFIPASITGHDSAYNWSCAHGHAQITAPSAPLDADGFLKDYWRKIE